MAQGPLNTAAWRGPRAWRMISIGLKRTVSIPLARLSAGRSKDRLQRFQRCPQVNGRDHDHRSAFVPPRRVIVRKSIRDARRASRTFSVILEDASIFRAEAARWLRFCARTSATAVPGINHPNGESGEAWAFTFFKVRIDTWPHHAKQGAGNPRIRCFQPERMKVRMLFAEAKPSGNSAWFADYPKRFLTLCQNRRESLPPSVETWDFGGGRAEAIPERIRWAVGGGPTAHADGTLGCDSPGQGGPHGRSFRVYPFRDHDPPPNRASIFASAIFFARGSRHARQLSLAERFHRR